MQKWKQIIIRILFPPEILVIVFSVISVVSLIYSFTGKNVLYVIQYFSYTLSAYTLTIVCCRIPNIAKKINYFSQNNPFIIRYKSDIKLRVKLSLYENVVINSFYSVFHLLTGLIYKSVWAFSLAIYYMLLSFIRLLLLRDTIQDFNKNIKSQWKNYRLCGIILILMNLALSSIVFLIVYQNKGFSYHFIHTISMAAFTFTITIIAIVNVIRYRKYNQPVVSAIKYISMASALVSILSLETAMLNAFGSDSGENFRRIITGITGGFICIIVLFMGIYMVINSNKKIKKLALDKIE